MGTSFVQQSDSSISASSLAAAARAIGATTGEPEHAKQPIGDVIIELLGESPAMQAVTSLIRRVGPGRSTVLIQGESGTGKELVARAVHDCSPRNKQAFVAVHCAAIAEPLFESELFGHVRGAFTGATTARQGLFETAHGGTIFLDEIGDMPLATQVRLLRVLQTGEIRPVGSDDNRTVDVRVVAATNVDLRAAIAAGRFREDLFYRLNVINLALPPLRDRPSEIPTLAYRFVHLAAAAAGKTVARIHERAMTALVAYPWPGNVRELENSIEHAVVVCESDEVTLDDLPSTITSVVAPIAFATMPYNNAKRLALTAFNRSYLGGLLAKTNGNVTAAAALAGLERSNFRRLLKQYEVTSRSDSGEFAAEETDPSIRPAIAALPDNYRERRTSQPRIRLPLESAKVGEDPDTDVFARVDDNSSDV